MASAIDFQSLLLSERRRAREAKKKKGSSGAKNGASADAKGPAGEAGNRLSAAAAFAAANGARSAATAWEMTSSLNPPAFVPSTHIIPSTIKSLYYIKHFLPHEYGSRLKSWLLSLPERLDDGSTNRSEEDQIAASPCWTKLRHSRRRVALFDGRESARKPLPTALDSVAAALVDSGVFPPETPPNHVLVNDYNPGEGIMPHTDGPSYVDRTATISIGGDVILKFRKRLRADEIGKAEGDCNDGLDLILSGAGSLVVFTGDAYSSHLHSIDEAEDEITTELCGNAEAGIRIQRAHRISLTFRHKLLD